MGIPRRPLEGLGASQRGLVTRGQLLEAGFSAASVVRADRWPTLLPGVYWTTPTAEVAELHRLGGPRDGWFMGGAVPWEVRARAVLLRWPEARLGGTSAAHVEGWADEPTRVSALLPYGRRGRAPAGVVLRRERPGVRTASRPGDLRRTRSEDTVLDIVGSLPAGEAEAVFTWVARCVGHRVTNPERILATLGNRGRMRWRRELVTALEDTLSGAASHLERRFVHGVHRPHGLPAVRQQLRRPLGEDTATYADVAYEGQQVLVDLDGRLGHQGAGVLRDRRRDNANTLAGWTTLRFGWHDVVGRPCAVAADVAGCLQRNGWAGRPRRCGASCEVGA
ncbi:hypothetical protein [Kytococcus sp. Marseille-QA3725]